MEYHTGDILVTVFVDKRETCLKSTTMETLGSEKVLDFLIGQDVNVDEVVTDPHLKVSHLMSKNVDLMLLKIEFSTFSKVKTIITNRQSLKGGWDAWLSCFYPEIWSLKSVNISHILADVNNLLSFGKYNMVNLKDVEIHF